MKATLAGFRTTVRDTITVVVNETVRADMQLQVGQLEEQVTVLGQSPLVETTNATLGIVIDEQKVVDLPLNGRNFTQLGTLIPGVVAPPAALGGQDGDATPGGFGNATGGFNVNGMRNQSNNFLLDGATNNDTFNTGFVLRPPPDAIQEFKILTHAFDAEYGRNAGSVVNVVTKSGTNALARRARWEFNRDDALQARNFFARRRKPALKQNQFGGAVGGPLVENRVFVFGYYEGFRNKQRHHRHARRCCRAAQRAGDFSGGAGDPRSADRPAVPRQRHPASAHQPDRAAAPRRLHAAAELDAGNRYSAVAERRGHAGSSSARAFDYQLNAEAHAARPLHARPHRAASTRSAARTSRRRATRRWRRCRTSWSRTPG